LADGGGVSGGKRGVLALFVGQQSDGGGKNRGANTKRSHPRTS